MYYKLPFDFGRVLEGKDVGLSSSIAENIAQHIQLLITTRQGENRFDATYGNAVWDLEFENSLSDMQWEEQFRTAVLQAVSRYELRIAAVRVTIHSELVEKEWPIKEYTEIKKRVVVIINALLVETGEQFGFKTELFLSPMSID